MCFEVACDGGRAWWVAPSYKVANEGWDTIKMLGRQCPGAEIREQDRMLRLPTGGRAEVRSADDPQSLRGAGLDLVVFDEAAFTKEAAWTEALRPALTDRQGKALFISTPKGHNWFWRLHQHALDGDPQWAAWQYPTSSNPAIAPEEIEAARLLLPERIFRQEYEAAFIDDAGAVFRRVMDAAIATALPPASGHEYVMGVDWGKHEDFTVLTVMDMQTKAMVAFDRFNQIDYAVQTARLETLAKKYDVRVIEAEANSIGDPVIEQLHRRGLPVRAWTATNATKAELIEGLALAFEQAALTIIPEPVLVGELQAFEIERLPSGMTRYRAPAGMHDDCVISLGLAWQACGRRWIVG